MIKFLSLFTLVLAMPLGWAQAALLNIVTDGRQIENHSLALTATGTAEGHKFELHEIGAGIRDKTVLVVNVNVYLGELLVSDSASFDKKDLLGSVVAQKTAAMRLTFLREVDSKKILTSFEESFKANDVNPKDPGIAKLIQAVRDGGDIGKGQILSIVAYRKETGDLIILEDAKGSITEVNGPSGLIRQVFSLWLGKPGDSGVERFQKALLQ